MSQTTCDVTISQKTKDHAFPQTSGWFTNTNTRKTNIRFVYGIKILQKARSFFTFQSSTEPTPFLKQRALLVTNLQTNFLSFLSTPVMAQWTPFSLSWLTSSTPQYLCCLFRSCPHQLAVNRAHWPDWPSGYGEASERATAAFGVDYLFVDPIWPQLLDRAKPAHSVLGGGVTNGGVDSECLIHAFKALLLSPWPGHTYLTQGTVCEQKQ